MSKPFIVGLSGYAGSGKDTVAKYLSTELDAHGVPNFNYAFAKPLKLMALTLLSYFGFEKEILEDRILKEAELDGLGFTPRKLMQLLGTQIGRELNPNIWIMAANEVREGIPAENKVIIVTDVRFDNEAQWVRDNGGLVVHIKRTSVEPKLNAWRRVLVSIGLGKWILHASERGVSKENNDYTLFNESTLKDLEGEIHLLSKAIRRRRLE